MPSLSFRWELIIFTALLVSVAFFSVFHLTESPSVWYDEGLYFQAAANLAAGQGATFQFAPDHLVDMLPRYTVGYPIIYLVALAFKLFGPSILVARSIMAAFIIGLAIAVYALVRPRFGVWLALGSLALVVTFPPLYGNGKSILGEVPALFFLVLSLIGLDWSLTYRAQNRSAEWPIILTGFFAGLTLATKLSFALFVLAFAFTVIWQWWRGHLRGSDVWLAGFFSGLPIALWLFIQYRALDSWKTIAVFLANPYGVNDLVPVFEHSLISFLTQAGPLYLLLMMIIWLISIWVRKSHRINLTASELAAFIFTILTAVAYLRIIAWHRYLLPAQIVSLVYLAPAALICLNEIAKRLSWPITKSTQYLLVLLTIAGLSIVGIYSLSFHSWTADFYQSHKTAFWEDYFSRLPASTSVFFYNTPEVAMFDHYRNYYQYLTLFEVGGPFGSEWLRVIRDHQVQEIIIKSDLLPARQQLFSGYVSTQQVYDYTILTLKSS